MSASDDIWILGIRMTKFGKHADKDTVDLAAEAATGALADAGVTMADIGVIGTLLLPESFRMTIGIFVIGSIINPRIFISTSITSLQHNARKVEGSVRKDTTFRNRSGLLKGHVRRGLCGICDRNRDVGARNRDGLRKGVQHNAQVAIHRTTGESSRHCKQYARRNRK